MVSEKCVIIRFIPRTLGTTLSDGFGDIATSLSSLLLLLSITLFSWEFRHGKRFLVYVDSSCVNRDWCCVIAIILLRRDTNKICKCMLLLPWAPKGKWCICEELFIFYNNCDQPNSYVTTAWATPLQPTQ